MSYFAKIENGIVVTVNSAEQDNIDIQEGTWVQTSYNTYGNEHPLDMPLRGNYAGIGFTYDEINDVFYAPQPYPSWTLNNTSWIWEAPTPYPGDNNHYEWDEETLSWESE
jgi:hypothetical protein|tara:strand:+ start:256 stop:585 length:330 start_codon:yes stop_codon:yes gene_type:complete